MTGSTQGILNSVLVTGGTDGLGRAAAVLLAEHGYQVFAGGRDSGKLACLDQLARERKLRLVPVIGLVQVGGACLAPGAILAE